MLYLKRLVTGSTMFAVVYFAAVHLSAYSALRDANREISPELGLSLTEYLALASDWVEYTAAGPIVIGIIAFSAGCFWTFKREARQ